MEVLRRGHLYEDVADSICHMVRCGTYRAGDRIPSIRALSSQMGVSITTAMEAYRLLEDRGIVEARPQSGYYVRSLLANTISMPPVSKADMSPVTCCVEKIVGKVFKDCLGPVEVQLGTNIPNIDLLPVDRLNRCLASAARSLGAQSVSYCFPGDERLRTQIAKRAATAGCTLSPEDVLITSGCQEAVYVALKSVCRPGDTVVIESPMFFNHLQIMQGLGLKVVEVPSSPETGISLDALRYVLEDTEVKACLLIPNFSNPLGCCIPDSHKAELAQLLARHGVPLIEDDVYGDLSFTNQRPRVVKAYDDTGMVILCSSFSKTLAPGYRVGWIAPGRFKADIEHQKILSNIATATPPQLAVAEFLAGGGYDHLMRKVRRAYARHVSLMTDAVVRHFPKGTNVSRPAGGFFLWVELPGSIDSLLLYEQARARGISVAPGPIFTVRDKYRNYIRLSAANWDKGVEDAVRTLGSLAGMQG
ncbi:MAG TPA: PLP-dependent aminotransferase family protein [Deltaproteobacteria bacterium]|nr:PLP-dependent aminotransferase family protein [Deltaproteobacteria bacterium]HOI06157.1 PLP-dependent aminotransferase family protein [Deltaproteobacteria bacterium]